jgi:hypothetical protein
MSTEHSFFNCDQLQRERVRTSNDTFSKIGINLSIKIKGQNDKNSRESFVKIVFQRFIYFRNNFVENNIEKGNLDFQQSDLSKKIGKNHFV